MRTLKRSLPFFIFVSLVFPFCSKQHEGPNPDFKLQVNDFLSSIPAWETEEIEPQEDKFIENVTVKNDAGTQESVCPVFERNLVRNLNNFVSVGTNFGNIWPGALIQGKSLETGELQLINTKRAPVTLVTNIALDEVSRTIVPNSVNAQQAIAEFMIAAGKMPEGSQAGAGSMLFQIEEASTFKQSMLSMGVHAGFTEPQSKVGLEGSLSVSDERSSTTHTVVAKYIQEMFTIRVADDLIATPADFFADDFTPDDLEALKNSGAMGANNIPLYIESVTYGRVLLFSMQSRTVSSANELSAALEASMADYASAGGSIGGGNEEIFATATHKIFSAGGTDAAANAAVANLDWSKFFVESPASTAVPISFVAKTVNGKKIVGLVQSETYQQRENCSLIEPPLPQTAKSFDVTVEWTATDNTGLCIGGGRLGSCTPNGVVFLERDIVGVPLTSLNEYKTSFTLHPDADGDGIPGNDKMSFTIRSTSKLRLPFGLAPLKSQSKVYDVRNLADGNHTLVHTFSNAVGSVKLTYRITRKANY
ncbi:MAG: thiol-activated cytolysin family protein [Chitinophagaceae bacterium]|nr:thiol-activated cytolysin family protein [Chitinophagaceae bacterium]MCW5927283.1 thiol-activated cytolysin family protein [Chitinophagaceae bacterium]